MRKLFCLLILFLCSAALAANAEILKYSVVVGGNLNGVHTMEKVNESEWRSFFEFNDRGRGPKLTSRIQLDDAGIPALVEVSGNNYFKVSVDERFSLEGRKAVWKNPSEQGEKELKADEPSQKAYYVTLNSVPSEFGLLANALLKSSKHKLNLLPDGWAEIGKAGELKISSGGKTQTVVQYTISGLDFTPTPVWLDQDGNYFASGGEFLFVIREGWHEAQKDLQNAQDAAVSARLSQIAKAVAHKPEKSLAVRNALLFDSETAVTKTGQTVVIQGNKIQQVGADSTVKIPEGAEVIDAKGKLVMPGLWDMHVHIGRSDGLLHLGAGVTSVRDLANNSTELIETKRKFDSAELVGPRIPMIAGFIDGPGPYAGPSRILVDTEEQARKEVDSYAKMGFQQIKLYSSLKPELVKPIAEQAKKHGMRLSGHIPAFMTAEQAVLDGYNEIQHLNMIFLNFFFDKVQDTRTPQRFIGVAENASSLDLKSEKVQSFIQLLRKKNIVVDPTIAIFEGLFTGRPGSMPEIYARIADRMPPQIRRGFLTAGLPVPEGKDQLYRDSFKKMIDMVGELYSNNITIVAGTDDIPGFTLHRELELYVDAGIPAPKVLQIATLGAARLASMDKQLGSIAAGKLADLIVVNGNPAEQIADIRKVEVVIKDGTVYQTADIYKSIGVKP
jgi:imidazolonepropionase-like amidohydrolase